MSRTITLPDLRARLDAGESLQLIDVRSPGEYAAGHIPGAINLPMQEAESRIDDLSRRQPVVLVCQSGRRAGITCELLSAHHDDLLVLEGGTSAWIQAGLPVVSSTATRWSLERQVRLAAGLLVLIGTVLAVTVHPAWIYLGMFVGAGLTFAGLTNICGMAMLFAKMPWNRPAKTAARPSEATR